MGPDLGERPLRPSAILGVQAEAELVVFTPPRRQLPRGQPQLGGDLGEPRPPGEGSPRSISRRTPLARPTWPASVARPSERSIIACAPAPASALPSADAGVGLRRRTSSAARSSARPRPRRDRGLSRAAPTRRRAAEAAGHPDEIPGTSPVAADELPLGVGPADGRHRHGERGRRDDVPAERSWCPLAPASSWAPRTSSSACSLGESRRAGRAPGTPPPARRPSRRGRRAPRRAPASPPGRVSPNRLQPGRLRHPLERRKWTPSTMASTEVTQTARARTTAASSPTPRSTRPPAEALGPKLGRDGLDQGELAAGARQGEALSDAGRRSARGPGRRGRARSARGPRGGCGS